MTNTPIKPTISVWTPPAVTAREEGYTFYDLLADLADLPSVPVDALERITKVLLDNFPSLAE